MDSRGDRLRFILLVNVLICRYITRMKAKDNYFAEPGGESDAKAVPIVAATSPPVDPDLINEWAGASVADVEFCHDIGGAGPWVIPDAEGLRDQTCVLAKRVNEDGDDDVTITGEFNKARVPWHQACVICCNLHLTNMGWGEFMEECEEDPEGRWWTLTFEEADGHKEARDKEVEELQRQDQA